MQPCVPPSAAPEQVPHAAFLAGASPRCRAAAAGAAGAAEEAEVAPSALAGCEAAVGPRRRRCRAAAPAHSFVRGRGAAPLPPPPPAAGPAPAAACMPRPRCCAMRKLPGARSWARARPLRERLWRGVGGAQSGETLCRCALQNDGRRRSLHAAALEGQHGAAPPGGAHAAAGSCRSWLPRSHFNLFSHCCCFCSRSIVLTALPWQLPPLPALLPGSALPLLVLPSRRC